MSNTNNQLNLAKPKTARNFISHQLNSVELKLLIKYFLNKVLPQTAHN